MPVNTTSSYKPVPASSTLEWFSAERNPPAESGWYPCSIRRAANIIRWYDKEKDQWSEYSPMDRDSQYAGINAAKPAKKAKHRLFWAKPWW